MGLNAMHKRRRLRFVMAGLTAAGLIGAVPGLARAQGTAPARPPAAAPATAPAITPPGAKTTLQQALAQTYMTNPQLLAARAQLRAVDENVPQALSGWRPTIVLQGSAGYADGTSRAYSDGFGATYTNTGRLPALGQATITQPLFNGGRTRASTNRAENQVIAQRAQLLVQEQQSLLATVNAFVGVIQAQDTLALDINNEQVLARQLQATNDRFRVGEITKTDVAQAQAALSGATATRQVAEGNLQVARGTYAQVVGVLPGSLDPPQPLAVPYKSEKDVVALALRNNPAVVAALFNDAAAKDAIDVAFSGLMPQLSLQATGFRQDNQNFRNTMTTGGQVVANLSIPLYQGGQEYSAVRQARQQEQQTAQAVDDARRTAGQSANQSWQTLISARAAIESLKAQIAANQVALDGVEREALVGSRTTLDVLNAQQALLQSEVNLVQGLAALVNASYSVANAVGRMTARDLKLNVPLYDDTAYYRAVRNAWFGTGDPTAGKPGR